MPNRRSTSFGVLGRHRHELGKRVPLLHLLQPGRDVAAAMHVVQLVGHQQRRDALARAASAPCASAGVNLPASTTNRIRSTSPTAPCTVLLSDRFSALSCRVWKPGVSTKTNWVAPSVRMPVMRCRVVWALREVMLIFWPTSALSRVDLPTLGLPTMAIRPQRWRTGGRRLAGIRFVRSFWGCLRACALSRSSMAAAAACSPARREPPMPRSSRPSSTISHSTSKVCLWAAPERSDDAVDRQLHFAPLQPFLQFGLGVLGGGLPCCGLISTASNSRCTRACGRGVAGIEVDGADHRLQRIGQDRRPVAAAGARLAFAQPQTSGKPSSTAS